MNAEFTAAIFATLWLGVLATVSPCPLGTNIAAVTLIAGGGGKSPRNALVASGAYGAGRMFMHMLIGMLIMSGLASAPKLMIVLQSVFAKFTGPIFMMLGVVLIDWVEFRLPAGAQKLKKKLLSGSHSVTNMLAIGCLFSLIPCPETAALFFGGLVPIAIKFSSRFALPAIFGLGTALPVMLIGGLLSIGVGKLASDLGKIRSIESVLRTITSIGFMGFGFYLTLDNVYYLF